MPGQAFLWPLYSHGNLAVQLFWVLSGFVFALAYGGSDRTFSFWQFGVYRFARLYPLHVITLVIVVSLQVTSVAWYGAPQVYGNNDLAHFIAHLGMASNWFTADSSFNAPVWSVSVEILVYFVFAIYAAKFKIAAIPAVVVALIFFGIERTTYSPIAWCGALFFIGILTALGGETLHKRLGRWAIVIASASCIAIAAGTAGLALIGHGGHEDVILAYFFMPCVILVASSIDRAGVPFPATLQWIGNSTYAVYMCHMPMVIAAKTFMPQWFSDPGFLMQPTSLALYVAAVSGVAYCAYRWVEMPLQTRIRDRLTAIGAPKKVVSLVSKAI